METVLIVVLFMGIAGFIYASFKTLQALIDVLKYLGRKRE